MSVCAFLACMGGIAWLDGKKVRAAKGKRELFVYLGLLGAVTIIGTLFLLDVRLPSPTDPIEKYVPPLSRFTGE
jgi:hypothetical protein